MDVFTESGELKPFFEVCEKLGEVRNKKVSFRSKQEGIVDLHVADKRGVRIQSVRFVSGPVPIDSLCTVLRALDMETFFAVKVDWAKK